MIKFVVALILVFSMNIYANFNIEGFIFNSETGEVIPGASVQIDNENYGTYTSYSGKFKLPLPDGKHRIKISSMGYKTHYMTVSEIDKELKIFLEPDPVLMKNVDVVAEISPENIIKRAIAKKEKNIKSLKSFQGELYSKFVIEVAGSAISNFSTDGGSISIGAGGEISDDTTLTDNGEKIKMYIMETFSNNYIDYQNEKYKSIITQRRQTSNIKPQDNLMVLSNFQSFYEDYYSIAETHIMNPLNDDALNRYKFELLEKQKYDDKYIYVLKIIPISKTYPTFEGIIKIVENTYHMIELDLRPSKYTAIPFIQNLHIVQKFEEIKDDIWHPIFLNVNANADINVVKGLMDIEADIIATSIYNNYKINENIPDSIFGKKPMEITIAPTADSTDYTFWENNSLRDLSDKEKKVYNLIGESSAKDDNIDTVITTQPIMPYFNFNRVESVTLGIESTLSPYGLFELNSMGAFSFGLQKPLGKIGVRSRVYNKNKMSMFLSSNLYSKVNTMTTDQSANNYFNIIFGLFDHEDYYDYYLSNGFDIGFDIEAKDWELNLSVQLENQFTLKKNTNRSIFEKKYWRENPVISEGRYLTSDLSFRFGEINEFISGTDFDYEINLTGRAGTFLTDEQTFGGVEGDLELLIPTIRTGYAPMMLRTKIKAGYTDKETPIQYQYRMPTRLSFISGFGAIFTAPIALYGGTQYHSLHIQYNLTDLWWRMLRLPKYHGRGIDLTLAFSTANYKSENNFSYLPTGDLYYSEAGFGLSRIPTFISNVAYLSWDFRWGVGPLAKDEYGSAISVSFPF